MDEGRGGVDVYGDSSILCPISPVYLETTWLSLFTPVTPIVTMSYWNSFSKMEDPGVKRVERIYLLL